MSRRAVAALLLVVTVVFVSSAAGAEPEHLRPQGPAKVAFGPGFPGLADAEWGFPLGGFGGVARRAPLGHVPVILVHGNNVDAADWYPVRDELRKRGWTDQEIWALSYNGLGGNNGTGVRQQNQAAVAEHAEMGWDGQTRITNNDVNVPDLYTFIMAVRAYTGSDRFSVVGHSLGVTLARKTLKVHPELRRDLVAFVGIAGGNHGTSFCPPGSEGNVVSCNEIAAGTPWLAELNGTDGADETYGPARWLTVYDGSGAADPAYAGPTYAESPVLQGATNTAYPGTYHNDLRLDPDIIGDYRAFIEQAEAARPATSAAEPSTSPPPAATRVRGARAATAPGALAATGALPLVPFGLLALGLGLVLRRRSP